MPGQKASEEARRMQILKAAYDVASRKGLDALTVRLVAHCALSHFIRRETSIPSETWATEERF